MPEETTGKQSAEEIRAAQRRAFDAFNEAQVQNHKLNREHSAAQDAEENRRWVKPEPGADVAGETAQNDLPGG